MPTYKKFSELPRVVTSNTSALVPILQSNDNYTLPVSSITTNAIVAASVNPAPVDSDLFPLLNNTNTLKKTSWSNIKTTMKSFLTPLEIGAAPALGLDDNYVTDAEKAALHAEETTESILDKIQGPLSIDAMRIGSDYMPDALTSSDDPNLAFRIGTVTIVDYTALTGVAFTIGGQTVTQGIEWALGFDNADTAANLSSAILGLGISGVATFIEEGNPVITITADTNHAISTTDPTNMLLSGAELDPHGSHIGQRCRVGAGPYTWWTWDGTAWVQDADGGGVADDVNPEGPLISAALSGKLDISATAADVTPTGINIAAALSGKVQISQLSLSGGANKVPLLDANGDWTTGSYVNNNAIGPGGNIFLPNKRTLGWLTTTGNIAGARIWMWEDHDPNGGELIIDAPALAIVTYNGLQIGPNDPAKYNRFMYVTCGGALSGQTGQKMYSGTMFLNTETWNGVSGTVNRIGLQAVPLDLTGTNTVLKIFNNASTYEDGNTMSYDRGLLKGNPLAVISNEGIWSNGMSPIFTKLPDTATITIDTSKYKTGHATEITLAGNRILEISRPQDGMKGRIYVKHSGDNHTLTPKGGTALDLSLSSGYVDLIEWDFDGIYLNFTTAKNIKRELAPADTDAENFITAANLSTDQHKAAIIALVDDLKRENLWTKFYGIYPFIGGNDTAHAKDLKGTYDITWAGNISHDQYGITGDGITGVGNTGIIQQSMPNGIHDFSLYAYNRTTTVLNNNAEGNAAMMGSRVTEIGVWGGAGGWLRMFVSGGGTAWIPTSFKNHFMICHFPDNTLMGYQGIGWEPDIKQGTGHTATTGAYEGIRILATTWDATRWYSNANLAFAAVGKGLVPEEYLRFITIIDKFQTALGRKN